jgi:hypothetical protein
MKRMPRWLLNVCLLIGLLAFGACNKSNNAVQVSPPDRFGPGGGPDMNADGTMSIKAIMVKLAKGPQSLTSVIGTELKSEPPPWDTLQTQAKEYVRYSAALEKNHPSKGSQESWAALTASYTQTATSLEVAVQGKDLEKARAAHQSLNQSCMACHQQHRGMGGPGGRFGPGAAGGPGGFGGPTQPGQLLPSFMQEMLKLTDEQKKELTELQKEVDQGLGKILNEEQKKELKNMQQGFGRPGGQGPGGPPPGNRPFDGPGPEDGGPE